MSSKIELEKEIWLDKILYHDDDNDFPHDKNTDVTIYRKLMKDKISKTKVLFTLILFTHIPKVINIEHNVFLWLPDWFTF